MKIFIFFGFSSGSILDKVKDTIKYLNAQEKTQKSLSSIIFSARLVLLFFSLAKRQRDKETFGIFII
jgi:hypothetical protein